MKVHRFQTEQRLPIPLETAWAFFSSPKNLRLITPDWLDFHITNDIPETMYPGALITYTVRPMLGLPVDWVTEITHMDAPHFFVDEQRFGPYRMWHHQHHFVAIEGGVAMTDTVDYVLPFGPLGTLLHALTVRKRVAAIFAYRRQALVEHFGAWTATAEATP